MKMLIMRCRNWYKIVHYFINGLITVCGPWSGRKRRERLSLEEEQWAEICPVTYRDIQLTSETKTASVLTRLPCNIGNGGSFWRPLVRTAGPWSVQHAIFMQQLFKIQSKEFSCTFVICFSGIQKNKLVKILGKRALFRLINNMQWI